MTDKITIYTDKETKDLLKLKEKTANTKSNSQIFKEGLLLHLQLSVLQKGMKDEDLQ